MFDGLRLNYYRKLSKKLKKEIEILKNSYEVVDSHIDLTKNLSEYNDTEKSIIETFGSFCKENGFSETERVGTLTYGEIKKKIQDRVAFLEKQNNSIEKFISSRDELEKLKDGTLSEDKARAIIAEARGKGFVSGTEESKKYIQKRKKEEIQKEKDDKKKSISDAKAEIRKNKKENGFGKVVNSITGPVGNWFYNNIYVPVQNVNVDLRNHKILNLGIKGVLLAGYVFGCASLSLTGFPLVASIAGAAIAGYNTIANTFFRKVPEKAKRREKAPSLKESWFRFRKSRGNGNLSVQDNLYKNIDLSKAGTRGSAERESEDVIPEEREREHEAAREIPEVPVDEHVEEREVPEEIVEAPEGEERDEKAHEIPRIEEAAEEVPEVPVVEPLTSVVEINSFEDAKQLYERLIKNDGCKTLFDWQSLVNAQRWLADQLYFLENVGSGLTGLSDAEKEVNKEYKEMWSLYRKINELGKNKKNVEDALQKRNRLSLEKIAEINSIEEVKELHNRIVKAGGIKTRADLESCKNAVNYLNTFIKENPEHDEKNELSNLKELFVKRISKIDAKNDDNELNSLYESIRFSLEEDEFLNEVKKRTLNLENRRELLNKYLNQRDNLIRACQNKYNQIVNMFSICEDYNELFYVVSDFLSRAGNTITDEQRNQLVFMLSSKKNEVESINMYEEHSINR